MPKKEAVTDREKIQALEQAKKTMSLKFDLYGESYGVCMCLPGNAAGLYMEEYIGEVLGNYAHVTSWLRNELNLQNWYRAIPDDKFLQQQFYMYRLRWIDHMINQLKKGK